MKNLLLLVAFIVVFTLSSSSDYSVCSGSMSAKSIVCSACHGGAISADIFIVDGKLEDASSEESSGSEEEDIRIQITLPVEEGQSVQLFSAGLNSTSRLVNGETGEVLGDLQIKESSVLYNVLALNRFRLGSQNYAKLDLALQTSSLETGEESFVLQGVISNNDGTPQGDQSFYKEISLVKKELLSDWEEGLSLYYAKDALNIESKGEVSLSIFSLSGQEFYSTKQVEMAELDLSFLPSGMYIALAQGSSDQRKILKFIKN
ncbi:MAG: T9SS type A sorting domain-containing protein [Chitinophagales bacterium]|nr:T9SS type A sorting domain-containing protein [Chitinophagales bacterium]